MKLSYIKYQKDGRTVTEFFVHDLEAIARKKKIPQHWNCSQVHTVTYKDQWQLVKCLNSLEIEAVKGTQEKRRRKHFWEITIEEERAKGNTHAIYATEKATGKLVRLSMCSTPEQNKKSLEKYKELFSEDYTDLFVDATKNQGL